MNSRLHWMSGQKKLTDDRSQLTDERGCHFKIRLALRVQC